MTTVSTMPLLREVVYRVACDMFPDQKPVVMAESRVDGLWAVRLKIHGLGVDVVNLHDPRDPIAGVLESWRQRIAEIKPEEK